MFRKYFIFILFALFLSQELSHAQSQMLQVYYLTKDYTTEVTPLCEELKDIYSSAIKDKSQAVVFYLANASTPIIVKINLPEDNRDDFSKITDALITKSETIIYPTNDLNGIVGLFDEIHILNEGGNQNFLGVELNYYVTPTFWELGYNEQIIASAYFALDMDALWAEGYMSMSIYHNASDGLIVDEEKPFGDKNLCANYKFFLMTYSN